MRPETKTRNSEAQWEEVAPLLDEQVLRLGKKDQEAILLRFYEQRPLAEVGKALGISEEAARMRVQRAVEKLRGILGKKGVTGTTAGLSAVLVGNVVGQMPEGLAEKIISTVVSGGGNSVAAGIAKGAMKMMTMAKVKVAAVVVLAAATVGGSVAVVAETSATRTSGEGKQPVVAASGAPATNGIWERLSLAAQLSVSTIGAKGTTRITSFPVTDASPADIRKKVEAYRATLLDQARNGQLPLDSAYYDEEILQKRFGTKDYRTIINNPDVQGFLNSIISERSKRFEQELLLQHSVRDEVDVFNIAFDPGRGVRINMRQVSLSVAGQRDKSMDGEETLTTINADASKEFRPSGPTAVLSNGVSKDKGLLWSRMLHPNPLWAGQPQMAYWSQKDIAAVEAVDTPEGRAERVSLAPGAPTSAILWLLPDKGYRLYREEVYQVGKLHTMTDYAAYREIQPGLWFPMKQRLARYRNGSLVSAEENTFTEVQLNPNLDKELFDQQFPVGTVVTDVRRGADEALQFVVQGQENQ